MDPKRLREATRREHEATEALLPLGHTGLTSEQYLAGLRALWPVVSSWERWAAEHVPAELRDLVLGRRRVELLAGDLAQMGAGAAERDEGAAVNWTAVVWGTGDPQATRQLETGPPLQEDREAFRARFLGALYVMEGSTLGGRFLARHVVAELGEAYAPATRYFQGHGEQTGSMWREVTARLAEVPESRANETIEAAQRAFRAFGEALSAGLTLTRHTEPLP